MTADRDELALREVFEAIEEEHDSLLFPHELAAAFLAQPWLANDRRAVAQQALRDAARDFPGFDPIRTHGDAKRWFRDRAARIAQIGADQ